MEGRNMKVLCYLDSQIDNLIKAKQKDFSCAITLYKDEESDHYYMSVLTFDCRVWDNILVSEKANKDRICVGIMRWFKAHGNEVKGG